MRQSQQHSAGKKEHSKCCSKPSKNIGVGSIYGLFDPTTGTLRYIGKTKYTPAVRVKGHVGNAKAGGRTHLCNWLRSLRVPPITKVLKRVPLSELNAAEVSMIRWHRQRGTPLVNTTAGGDGGTTKPGRTLTQEQKDKIGAGNRGVKKPWLAERNRKSPPFTGFKHSEETKAVMAEKARGRKHPELAAYNRRPEVREARRYKAIEQWRTKRGAILSGIHKYHAGNK